MGQYIEIERKPSRALSINVRVCNTAKYDRDRTMRAIRKEVRQHLKAIWRCHLRAKRARLDYKLAK